MGIVILVRPLQCWNAYSPMVVAELGISTLVSPLQPANAHLPMVITEFGIMMLASSVIKANAHSPMVVTEFGITVVLQPSSSVLLDVSMMALQLLRESYIGLPLATVILVSPLQ